MISLFLCIVVMISFIVLVFWVIHSISRKEYKGKLEKIGIIVSLFAIAVQIIALFTSGYNGVFQNTVSILNENIFGKNVNSSQTSIRNYYQNEEKSEYELLRRALVAYESGDFNTMNDILSSEQLKNNPIALCNLGYVFALGVGTEKNQDIATKYFNQAIEMGYEKGYLVMLAFLFNTDIEKADSFLMKHKDCEIICESLGKMLDGIDVSVFLNNFSLEERISYYQSVWYNRTFEERVEETEPLADSFFTQYEFISSRKEIGDSDQTINYYTYDKYKRTFLFNNFLYFYFRDE